LLLGPSVSISGHPWIGLLGLVYPSTMPDLTPKQRRAALEVLSRDRLAEITTKFKLVVEDRRAQVAHVNSIINARNVEFAEVLQHLSREELKSICGALGIDDSGKEKDPIVARILSGQSAPTRANGDGKDFVLSPQPPKARRAQAAPARPNSTASEPIGDYRHDATRKNNPPAGLIDLDRPPAQPTRKYSYDPHLDPQLQWSGKAERTSFDVDVVSLHIHERVSTQAIMRAVKREEAQRDLFAQGALPPDQAVDFYAHDVGWSNRLVLGDSLLVMNSLLEREQMAGRVQCIYLDPPYGVKFNSNFQPSISRRDVKDGDDGSLTREPEQIQAYRDTWTLGIHSYLTYLRDRLLVARDLLHGSGSIFVQISDENVHHVRELMDEVFGADNFVAQIVAQKTGGLGTSGLKSVADYLLWYGRDKTKLKYRQLYRDKVVGIGEGSGGRYDQIESPDGRIRRPLTAEEKLRPEMIPGGWRVFRLTSLKSGAFRENTTVPYTFEGETFHPGKNSCWKTTLDGLDRLARARRIQKTGKTIDYVRYLEDFPAFEVTNVWSDVGGAADKVYVVQTSVAVIVRCILMTTDPGDLVLDPTCGSGTTAFVAEHWGRRWVTCDTSRVALAIARQRMLTARYPYYSLRSIKVKDGFKYKSVPHITLKSIAQNPRLDACEAQADRERVIREAADQEVLYDQPEEDRSKVRVSGPFTVEAIPVASMEDPSGTPIPQLEPEDREDDVARPGRGGGALAGDGGDYIGRMIDLLRKTGVHFKNKKSMPLASLRPVKTAYEYLHAEADTGYEGDPRRVAISFGSAHGPVTPKQVLDAIQQTRGYDIVLFVGFACDPEAGRMIEQGAAGRELHFVHAAPDILVGDLLKDTKATKLFTVFGLPDVKWRREGKEITVTLAGVDLYDPITGETSHDEGNSVAAWFLDHDFDGRTFCICQAFFPSGKAKNPWEKLQKALKGSIDEQKFEALRTTTSIPFKPGKKIAVKVIDDRGNEVIKVVEV
jgi:adenine-specific DNA-methyltransferase